MSKKDNKKNKEKLEQKQKEVKRKKEKSNVCFNIILILTSIKVAIVACGLYHVYKNELVTPDMPNIDMDAWWGPNEKRNSQDTSIRPFRVVFSNGLVEDLAARFEKYRSDGNKKKSMVDTAWTYGVNSEAFGEFVTHWLFTYSYRERVKFLNQFDHFKTNIQGLDIHYMHIKPKVDFNIKVVPLLLLHGWPGSVREFYEAIPLLTTPREGYDFVFEVIAPSLPGFVYSQAAVRPGMSSANIAVVMRNLMHRLGFTQYYVQGGDFGHVIGANMITIFPKEVLGFHTNCAMHFTKPGLWTYLLGTLWPTLVEPEYTDRLYPLKNITEFYLEEFGYSHLQMTKPDTIGVALQDSPPGLAAYILDRFMFFTNPNNKLEQDGGFSKYYNFDDLIDNIMLYWATNSITTSMRAYKESVQSDLESILEKIPTNVPTWALRLKHELFFTPEFILRWKFTNLLGTTTVDFGGHFAAFERPKEFSDDVFKAVKRFREFKMK